MVLFGKQTQQLPSLNPSTFVNVLWALFSDFLIINPPNLMPPDPNQPLLPSASSLPSAFLPADVRI